MKVLQIANNYSVNKLYGLLFDKLEGKYIDNYVYCPLNNGDTFDEVLTDHIVLKKCFNSIDRLLFYTKQKKMLRDIEKYFDVVSFKVIHAHTLFSGGYSAYKLSQKYGIPYIVAVRDTDVNTFFKYMLHLRGLGVEIMRNASAVIFLSPAYRDSVIDKYVPEKHRREILDKSYVIPNGIDDFWHINSYCGKNYEEIVNRLKRKELKVLSVGVVQKRKNFIVVAKALEILRKQGWNVNHTIIGEARDSAVYNELVNNYDACYIAKQPKEKLIDYYRGSDIFVLASKTETFGLVYAEAMSQGLPVLYSKGQGFDGQFVEGTVGYHVDSHDPNDIAEKIKLVCQNYHSLSRNALEKVVKFRWSDIAKEYVELYGELTGVTDGVRQECRV